MPNCLVGELLFAVQDGVKEHSHPLRALGSLATRMEAQQQKSQEAAKATEEGRGVTKADWEAVKRRMHTGLKEEADPGFIFGRGETGERIVSESGGVRNKIGRRYDLIPLEAMDALAEVLHKGAQKYAPHNWKHLDFDSEQSPLNHAIKHLLEEAAVEAGGENPTGEDHAAHAICNIAFWLWWKRTGKDQGRDNG